MLVMSVDNIFVKKCCERDILTMACSMHRSSCPYQKILQDLGKSFKILHELCKKVENVRFWNNFLVRPGKSYIT